MITVIHKVSSGEKSFRENMCLRDLEDLYKIVAEWMNERTQIKYRLCQKSHDKKTKNSVGCTQQSEGMISF